MATTEILLIKPVEGLGHEGDRVKVKAGYARNFLLPREIAIPVNRANQKHVDALLKRKEARLAHLLETAEVLKAKIETLNPTFAVKTGQGGKLFGSITNIDLHQKLEEAELPVDRHKIHLAHPIKELGKHTAMVKLHAEVTAELNFEVFSENPVEEEETEGAEEEAPKEATAAE